MPANSGMFPALNLFPLNDSFIPKHIVLASGQHVKVGRQTNAKTVPGEKNGYFDSKVLSRQHAEVWEEGGKIYIKDVKSSNGTFINGTRLSQEGVESAPFELNTDDIVEFGIDIVGEDNQTIIHHKVAAKVQCLLTQEDVNAAQQQAVYAQQAQQHNLAHSQQGHLQQGQPGQRRPSLHGGQNLQGSLGALAPVGRAPNKNGLSFDLILSRLQNEVQRSRETSAELHSLTAAMSEIHDSLGGVSAQPVPAYPHILPPVRHDSDPSAQQPQPPPQDTAVINTLQEQLHQTQSLLSSHVERIHSLGLEGIVGEHDGIKREIGMLRDMIDQRKLDVEIETNAQSRKRADDEDEDDGRSVATIHAGEQFSDEEIDDENDEERRRRRDELGRPRTPEPSMGMDDSDGEGDIGIRGVNRRGPRGTIRRGWDGSGEPNASESSAASRESVERLHDRLEQLAAQFESALELSRELQAKQAASQEQIASLQAKVDELEASREPPVTTVAPPEPPVPSSEQATPSVVANLVELTKNLEGRWERQREEWEEERERLKATKEEWERRVRRVEEDISGVREVAATASTTAAQANLIATTSAKELSALAAEFRSESPLNGVDQSEFAPPSPKSISSDGLRGGGRKRPHPRRRSRSSSPSPIQNLPNGHSVNGDEGVQPYSPNSLNSAPYSGNGKTIDSQTSGKDGRLLSSMMKGIDADSRTDSMSSSSAISTPERKPDIPLPYMSAVATLGVALIGVAAWTAANHIHA